MKKSIITSILLVVSISANAQSIDRKAVVTRNNPVVTQFDALNSLSVGNGHFAVTVDATGLQSFPEECENGLSLIHI